MCPNPHNPNPRFPVGFCKCVRPPCDCHLRPRCPTCGRPAPAPHNELPSPSSIAAMWHEAMDDREREADFEARRPSRPPPRTRTAPARRKPIKPSRVVRKARWNRTLAKRGRLATKLPQIGRLLRTGRSTAGSPQFALAIAKLQQNNGLDPGGLLTPATIRLLMRLLEMQQQQGSGSGGPSSGPGGPYPDAPGASPDEPQAQADDGAAPAQDEPAPGDAAPPDAPAADEPPPEGEWSAWGGGGWGAPTFSPWRQGRRP